MYYTVIKHDGHLRKQGKSVFYISQVFLNAWSVLPQFITMDSRFLKPSIFCTSRYLEPEVVSPPQLNTVILPPSSLTL